MQKNMVFLSATLSLNFMIVAILCSPDKEKESWIILEKPKATVPVSSHTNKKIDIVLKQRKGNISTTTNSGTSPDTPSNPSLLQDVRRYPVQQTEYNIKMHPTKKIVPEQIQQSVLVIKNQTKKTMESTENRTQTQERPMQKNRGCLAYLLCFKHLWQ